MTDWLDQMVGTWRFEGRSVPDDPARRQTGIERVTRRSAWLVIEGDDYRFQIALNPDGGDATGDFIHWDHPQLWTYRGGVAADGRLHLQSRGPSFDVEGEEADYDDVFEIVSPDHRRQWGRVRGADGRWRDFSETEYRRLESAA